MIHLPVFIGKKPTIRSTHFRERAFRRRGIKLEVINFSWKILWAILEMITPEKSKLHAELFHFSFLYTYVVLMLLIIMTMIRIMIKYVSKNLLHDIIWSQFTVNIRQIVCLHFWYYLVTDPWKFFNPLSIIRWPLSMMVWSLSETVQPLSTVVQSLGMMVWPFT